MLDEKFQQNALKFAIFDIYEIWQIFKRFTGTFRRAQTLKLGGVYYGMKSGFFVDVIGMDGLPT